VRAMPPLPHGLCCINLTADGLRACGVQHAVEDRHADRRFGVLSIGMARLQARADERLVAAHRRFDQGSPAITARRRGSKSRYTW
jgi:hypothetical protein